MKPSKELKHTEIRLNPSLHKEPNALWQALHEAYSHDIRRYVAARVSDPDTVEDIVQYAFVKTARTTNVHKFLSGSQSYPLYRLMNSASNLLTDHYRTDKSRFMVSLEQTPLRTISAEEVHIEKSASSEAKKTLQTAMKTLTPQQQKVITMRQLEERSYEEIATHLHLSIQAVRALNARGLAGLRKVINK